MFGGAVFCGPPVACGTGAVWGGSEGRVERIVLFAQLAVLESLLLREKRRLRRVSVKDVLCGGKPLGTKVLFEAAF
jgi:hypothetical protein